MFKDERDFRKAVAGMRIDTKPNPAHRERLRRQMLATFESAGQSAGAASSVAAPVQPRRISIVLMKLAVAAVVTIAAGVGIQQLLRLESGPLTFSQIRQATQKMAWLHAVVTEYRDGAVRTDQQWDNFAAQKTYTLMADGSVLHSDYGAGQKKLLYSPRVKAMVVTELPGQGLFGAASAHTLIDSFAVFAARDDVAMDAWTDQYEGKSVRVFEIDRSDPGMKLDGKAVAMLRMRLMADLETKRLVAAHIEKQGIRGALLAREEWVISYPQSGPASIYDLGVPRAVKVIDQTTQTIGTPGAEPRPISTPGDAGRSQLVPLKIELPRPLFVGTPQDNRVANLEKPKGGPRQPFLAPLGTTNVALGKPVTSSESDPLIGTLDMITDGDKEAADGSFVELGPGAQHITLDLKGEYAVYAVVVWHYHQQPRVYFDVVVQVANDPSFSRGVRTLFNNDIDNSASLTRGQDRHYTETNEGKLIDAQGARARYVRLYSHGNTSDDLNHYTEVEVYGRPAR
jgi:hypothetical protein